jgi:hypothetical protein
VTTARETEAHVYVLLQLLGAVLILLPFVRSQLGSLSTDGGAYLWPNLVGSILLAILAVVGGQWGFVLLEACWAFASASALRRNLGVGARNP